MKSMDGVAVYFPSYDAASCVAPAAEADALAGATGVIADTDGPVAVVASGFGESSFGQPASSAANKTTSLSRFIGPPNGGGCARRTRRRRRRARPVRPPRLRP